MTLKQILKLTEKAAIMEELISLYPECLPYKAELERVINYINETPAFTFEAFEIHIALMDPSVMTDFEDDIDEDAYLVVSGYAREEDMDFTLGFTKWEEWSNAEILIEEDILISNETLAAVCLYEMTVYGYDQETIAREFIAIESGLSAEMFH
ncbi:hypothetical protein KHM83_08100 [Fusibacter paucivorans]|uniref:Immunity protein Imm6 n=1 Tax=Fusibacter paucivorans TaxID=76009 RepID=A0ABS5PN76_9FIRM|nr:DUF6557 family protein [Fusibacter paucivorans]MBS7526635.1 hypothetical protein [Fusibacter paucivorans]